MTAVAARPNTHFDRPDALTAAEPPEQRGLRREDVRLLVAEPGRTTHTRFAAIGEFLRPGDLVVVNTSATLAAETDARRADGSAVVLHVATALPDGSWVIELRTAPDAARPIRTARPGERLQLAGDGQIRLLAPYPDDDLDPAGRGLRLWRCAVAVPNGLRHHLATVGRPISYGYLSGPRLLADYQTVFAVHPGSAEMPSAGRPFSAELVARLIAQGVQFAPVTLHTGVSSQEAGESPQPEWFSVPRTTARLINQTHRQGGRVVATGTTVTRALESAAAADATVRPASGWTDLVIGPDSPLRAVDGLITGLHDPDASHLLLVEAVAGPQLTQQVYDEAVAGRYRWHEFGDSCLLLPGRARVPD